MWHFQGWQWPSVFFVRPDDGASGQTSAVCGPSEGPRAVGSGEQDGGDPTSGHWDLNPATPCQLLMLTLILEDWLNPTCPGTLPAPSWSPPSTANHHVVAVSGRLAVTCAVNKGCAVVQKTLLPGFPGSTVAEVAQRNGDLEAMRKRQMISEVMTKG